MGTFKASFTDQDRVSTYETVYYNDITSYNMTFSCCMFIIKFRLCV